MGHSKHELGAINMSFSLKQIRITPPTSPQWLPPHNSHLFLSPRLPIVERFDCTVKIGHDTIHKGLLLKAYLQGERVTLVLGLS